MKQINFRIDDDYFTIIKTLADESNTSIADLAKHMVLEKSQEKRLDIALLLYEKGKIGLKRAGNCPG